MTFASGVRKDENGTCPGGVYSSKIIPQLTIAMIDNVAVEKLGIMECNPESSVLCAGTSPEASDRLHPQPRQSCSQPSSSLSAQTSHPPPSQQGPGSESASDATRSAK